MYCARVTRCCDAVFKFFYYAAMATWGASLLKDQPWVPWVLGGHGETRFCWTGGFPFQEVPEDLRRFYLTAVGYSISEIAMLLRDRRLPHFWEIVLHGATDVLIYASKAIVDTNWNHLIAVSYFGL